jgi:hypothetical protein
MNESELKIDKQNNAKIVSCFRINKQKGLLNNTKKENPMRKRWVVIIGIVVLIAAFIVYQYYHSRSATKIEMIEGDIIDSKMAFDKSSFDRSVTESALWLDVPVNISSSVMWQ